MNKAFHAVEAARKWRERVSCNVAGLSPREKVAHFRGFESVDALKAKAGLTKALPAVLPTRRKKGFDAVTESRKWKASTAHKRALAPAA